MATVERYSSKESVPVKQAVLAPEFKFDTSSAEIFKAGADVANVFAELAIRRQEAQDSLAATKASKNRIMMEQEMRQAMVDDPDPNNWEMYRAKIAAKYEGEFAKLKMSKKMREKQSVEWQAATETLKMNVQLAATTQDIKNDIVESGALLIDIMTNDDNGKMDAQEELDAIDRYRDALLRDTTPELAEIKLNETLKKGALGYWENKSKIDHDGVIAAMEKRKKALGTRGGEGKDGLNAKDMDDVIASAQTAKRLRNYDREALRDDTYRQMLTDFWNGELTDVQDITDALDKDLISPTNAKYLRDAMLNPDPPKHKLTAEAQVLQAIEDIGTGAGDKQDAIDVLTMNIQNLDPEKGSSLLKAIFSAQDKNISEIQRESRSVMEELIRDKDKISGLFTDDERQITAHAEAYLMLDEEIKRAAQAGKPLTRNETLIRAVEIGRQMKKKIKSEKATGLAPSFTPPSEQKKGRVNTMIKPNNMAEFDAAIDALPTEDAKRRYFQKWYKDVPK